MDSRNVNFSIKKSQIHTHMLGLSQKLTKLEMVLKTSVALDLGLVPKNWPWNELLFTLFTTKAPPGGHWWNRVFTQILHTKSWHTFKEKSLRISLVLPCLFGMKFISCLQSCQLCAPWSTLVWLWVMWLLEKILCAFLNNKKDLF